eukprot:11747428-Alexandrium_andersonii.AAC.1
MRLFQAHLVFDPSAWPRGISSSLHSVCARVQTKSTAPEFDKCSPCIVLESPKAFASRPRRLWLCV